MQEQAGFRIALGKLLVSLAHDVGKVAELRHVLSHADRVKGPVEGDLPRGGAEQVFAAEDVRDAHECVIHGVHEGVQRSPVGAHHGEVRHGSGLERDFPAHEVVESQVFVRHAQAQYGAAAFGLVLGELFLCDVAVKAVVAKLRIPAGGAVPCFDLLRGGVRLIDVTAGLELGDDVLVNVAALRLAVRFVRAADLHALVPVDAEPLQRLKQLVVALLAVAGRVSVLDPENQLAAGVPRVGPVE